MVGGEVALALGAGAPGRSVPILVFIPSVDRFGKPVDQAFWTDEALKTLGMLYGGATALPAGRGTWWDEELGQLLHESIIVVFCLASTEQVDDLALMRDLGRFLRQLGREAQQGEVGVVVDGDYYGIRDYDKDDDKADER